MSRKPEYSQNWDKLGKRLKAVGDASFEPLQAIACLTFPDYDEDAFEYLAKHYRLQGDDRAELCEWNAEVRSMVDQADGRLLRSPTALTMSACGTCCRISSAMLNWRVQRQHLKKKPSSQTSLSPRQHRISRPKAPPPVSLPETFGDRNRRLL